MSDRLDPDQDRHFVGLDLVPNCLQSVSGDEKICRLQAQNCERRNESVQNIVVFNSLTPGKFFKLFGRLLIFFFQINFFLKTSKELGMLFTTLGSFCSFLN